MLPSSGYCRTRLVARVRDEGLFSLDEFDELEYRVMPVDHPSTKPKKTWTGGGYRAGKNLGTKGIVAQALLEQGVPYRTIEKQTGVSKATLVGMNKYSVIPRDQVESVKKSLQDDYTLAAHSFLKEAQTKEKLKDAKAADLVRMSALCFDRSGLATHAVDQFMDMMSQYKAKKDASSQSAPKVITASSDNSQSTHDHPMDTEDNPRTT